MSTQLTVALKQDSLLLSPRAIKSALNCRFDAKDSQNAEPKMKILQIVLLVSILSRPSLAPGAPQANTSAFSQQKLLAAVTEDPPYTMKTEDGRWAGFSVDLWSQVARTLTWDYELVEMSFEDIIAALRWAPSISPSLAFFKPPRGRGLGCPKMASEARFW